MRKLNEVPLINKIYLAGPWFTPEQMMTQESVEALVRLAEWPHFSPRLECLVQKDDPISKRVQAFSMNVECVKKCRLVLANIDGSDAGTMWEIGAAHAYGTPIVLYSANPQKRLNLMLAQGCNGFLAGLDKVKAFLERVPTPPMPAQPDLFSKEIIEFVDDFNWKEVERWTSEVI